MIGVGRATRLLGYLTKADKTYASTIRLGVSTNTDDADGEVISAAECSALDDASIEATFASLRGQIDQVPSAVSAVKVDGRRAYKRVRSGEDVHLPSRRITIHELQIEDICRGDGVPEGAIDVDVIVRCSAGTYIRAIARDAGQSLGVGGHVRTLRRTASGSFEIDSAHPLSQVEQAGSTCREWLITMREAAMMALPTVHVDATAAGEIAHGRVIDWPGPSDTTDPVALVDSERLLAIAQRSGTRSRYLAVLA